MRPLTPDELEKSDFILGLLPDDPNEALLVLSFFVEAVCSATGESLGKFVERMIWWQSHRP